jgi:hypothetical protein
MSASIKPGFNPLPETGVQQRLRLESGQLQLAIQVKMGEQEVVYGSR